MSRCRHVGQSMQLSHNRSGLHPTDGHSVDSIRCSPLGRSHSAISATALRLPAKRDPFATKHSRRYRQRGHATSQRHECGNGYRLQ